MVGIFYADDCEKYLGRVADDIEDIVILHFVCMEKPWKTRLSDWPPICKWYEYLYKTPHAKGLTVKYRIDLIRYKFKSRFSFTKIKRQRYKNKRDMLIRKIEILDEIRKRSDVK